MTNHSYPGGSKSRVSRAGSNIREGKATAEDFAVIEEWRAAHRGVLNTFQAVLRTRTRGTNVLVAQRHKRKRTIFDKLQRLPGMQLARMDDVAGCRLIFSSIKDLEKFRSAFHKARFNHKLRNDPDKYNYIKSPKDTGYRGIHDVYEYDVNSDAGRALTGLYIEIQYRTLIQHAWATAVEVIGFITESQPKFKKGDTRYERAMSLASEMLARAHEKANGPFPDLKDREYLSNFWRSTTSCRLCKPFVVSMAQKAKFRTSVIQFLSFPRPATLRQRASETPRMLFAHCLSLKSNSQKTT